MLRIGRWRKEGWFDAAVVTMRSPVMTRPDPTGKVVRILDTRILLGQNAPMEAIDDDPPTANAGKLVETGRVSPIRTTNVRPIAQLQSE
jgi:hypothetical protein